MALVTSIWQRGIAMVGDPYALRNKYDWWIPRAKQYGITAVTIKVAHGLNVVNAEFFDNGLHQPLLNAGIRVGTWSFPTGEDPQAEGDQDARLALRFRPYARRWHITNAEFSYKIAPWKCEAYAQAFRRRAPLTPAALCPESNMFLHPILGPITGDFNYHAFSARAFRDFPQTYDGDMRAYEAADVWQAHARQDGNGSTFGPNRVKVCIGTAGDLRASPSELMAQMKRLKERGFTSAGVMFFLGETMLEEDFTILANYCVKNGLYRT